jgi:lipopolysaccharide transport system ATP-binding protein
MSDVVISVENVSKRYLVGHRSGERGRYTALRDVIAREARNFARKAVDVFCGRQIVQGDEVEEFWALKDVSFNVKRGEVIGIIGKNGAGKSTVLKILSRITEPTAGRVRLRGRVASLLEVGTGFHPELTGRENIFLNGAILGMTRREIRRKFDEIVAFAEVEKFLDTPVKHYSSGMYVRLAFAVAAHLEPEILVIDEVLAVGDAEFQKKCLGKMSEVAVGGRTILFVSHNLSAVTRICKQAIVLDQGRVGGIYHNVEQAVSHYLSTNQGPESWSSKYDSSLPANEYFVPLEVTAECHRLGQSTEYSVSIRIYGQLLGNDPSLVVALGLYTSDGSLLLWTTPRDVNPEKWMTLLTGPVELEMRLPTSFLNEGDYYVELAIMLHNQKFLLAPGAGPKVYFSMPGKVSNSEFWDRRRPGYLSPMLDWHWKQPSCMHGTVVPIRSI